MKTVQYFKTTKETHRFNKNQKVWIEFNFANHLWIYFRWRGKGRYVRGTIGKIAFCVGEIKSIKVNENFAMRVLNWNKRKGE